MVALLPLHRMPLRLLFSWLGVWSIGSIEQERQAESGRRQERQELQLGSGDFGLGSHTLRVRLGVH